LTKVEKSDIILYMSGKRKLHSPDWYLIYEETEEETIRKKSTKLKQNYGLSFQDLISMYERQGKKCLVCTKEMSFENRGCHVDHDHQTGKVRGLLCRSCNLLLGYAEDNIQTLKSAIKYLKEFNNGKGKEQFA
jgi:hypothetical protein